MGQAQDYEGLIRELLAGVASGWSYGHVIVFLMTNGVEETDLAQWLRKFAKGLSLEQDRELIEQLNLLGKMTPGKLALEAFLIAASFDVSYGQDSELLNSESWYSHSKALRQSGQYQEAIDNCDRAIQINRNCYQAWYNRGIVLNELGHYEESIISFEYAIQIHPKYDTAWYSLGNSLNHVGRYKEAINSCNQAIKINPNCYHAWCNRGISLNDSQQYYEAIDNCDRAIQLNCNCYQSWYCRGSALFNLGQLEDAIASYEQVIKITLVDHQAWHSRGIALGYLQGYQFRDQCLPSIF
jgi:tetratricopeptide (TPR) repeat protein